MGAFDDLVPQRGGGAFDDLIPQKPKRDVGALEAAGRGAGATLAGQGNTLALAAAVPAVVADFVANLFRDKPSTAAQDFMFENVVDPTRNAQRSYAIDPNAEQMGAGATVANVVGSLGAMAPSMIAGGAATVGPKLAALPAFIQNLAKGAVAAQPSFALPSTVTRAEDLLDAGVDGATVAKASASNLAANTAMGALPLSKAGGLLARAGSGAALNAATGAAQRGAEGAILGPEYEKMAQPAFGGKEMGMDAGIGALMAAIMGPRAHVPAPAPRTPDLPALPAPEPRPALPAPDTTGTIRVDSEGVAKPELAQDAAITDVVANLTGARKPESPPALPDNSRVIEGEWRQVGDALPAPEKASPAAPIRVDAEGVARPETYREGADRTEAQAKSDEVTRYQREELGNTSPDAPDPRRPDYQPRQENADAAVDQNGNQNRGMQGAETPNPLRGDAGVDGARNNGDGNAGRNDAALDPAVRTQGVENAARPADPQQSPPRLHDNAGADGRPGLDAAGNRGNDGAADGQRRPPADDAGARAAPEPAARPADAARAADNGGAARVVASPREVPRLQVEHGKVSTQIKRLQTTLETWRARAAEGGLAEKAAAAMADKIANARKQVARLKATRAGIEERLTPERLPRAESSESILSDLRAEGGVTPEMALDMGIDKGDSKLVNGKGMMSEDQVIAAAVKRGWMTWEESQQHGAYQRVIDMVRDERAGESPRGDDFEAQGRQRERAEIEAQAKELGIDITDMTRGQAIDAINAERMKGLSRAEQAEAEAALRDANEAVRDEADARTIDEILDEVGVSERDIEDAKYRREAEIERAADGNDAQGARRGGEGDSPEIRQGENRQDEKRPDAGPGNQHDDGGQRPGLELTGENRADAESRIKRESAAERDKALKEKQARDREEADAQRGNFQLEGSDRAADAGGQTDLAGNSPKRGSMEDATRRLNALPLDAVWDGLKRTLRHMVSDDAASGPLRKAIADLFSDAKGMNKREALARTLGALVWSDASVLKSVAEARNSPTLGKVWRMFSDMGGTEKIHGETFEQEVHARYNRNANETTELLKGLTADQIKQTRVLLENRSNIRAGAGGAHKAAKRIAEMLDAERKWLTEQGVELGDVKNYVPRVYLAREIVAKAAQFREAATKAYREMGVDDPAAAAEAWYQATKLKGDGVPEVPFLDLTSGAPQKNFTKTREIPIDVIRKSGLDKFLDTDLSGVLDAYYRRTAKRGAFESRFGGTAKDGSGNAKWNEMRKALDEEGNADLIDFAENRILSMSGQMKADVSDGVRSAMSLARAVTVATFLRRAVISSLTEPLQIGNRTAAAGAGKATANTLKMYARGANDLVRALTGIGKSASREDQYRMARMLGTILHENVESGVASLRFDGDTLPNERGTAVSRMGDRLSFAAMKASGLHDWTQANMVDSTIIGMDFVKAMAEDAATGKRLANYELDRLGIAEADHAEFSKYAAKVGNADQLIADLRAGNKQAAQYVAALDKFTRQVIMKPTAADKPILAKHPVAQMAYGLQSWMYSYWYNVQKANLNQIKEAATGEGYTKGERATMVAAPVLYTSAVLAMTGGLLTAMRDLYAGRDKDKEREEKNKKAAIMGVPLDTLRTLSQAQMFGLADPFINSMTSARYNKLPGSELGGPAFGRAQTLGLAKAGVMSDKNSDATNTAERKQAEAFYNLAIDPALAATSAALPMPLAAVATFASQRDELRQAYVNQSAGPAKKRSTDYSK